MSRTKRNVVLRHIVYSLLTVVFFVLQNSRLLGFTLWSACMNVMPFAVAALAIYEGPYIAGSVGFFAGLLLSLSSQTLEGLASLWLSLFAVIFAWTAVRHFRNNMLLAFLGGAFCLVFGEACKYVFFYSMVYGVGTGTGALTLLGSLLLSAPCGIIVIVAVRLISRKLAEDGR